MYEGKCPCTSCIVVIALLVLVVLLLRSVNVGVLGLSLATKSINVDSRHAEKAWSLALQLYSFFIIVLVVPLFS
jgi:hypothetical protein